MKKIKIISDGFPGGTHVYNAETNEPIEGVMSIDWKIESPGHLAVATITLVGVEVEVIGVSDAEH